MRSGRHCSGNLLCAILADQAAWRADLAAAVVFNVKVVRNNRTRSGVNFVVILIVVGVEFYIVYPTAIFVVQMRTDKRNARSVSFAWFRAMVLACSAVMPVVVPVLPQLLLPPVFPQLLFQPPLSPTET